MCGAQNTKSLGALLAAW